ncbi:D-alanyl-D-alanine carboxypeptidase family protein [Pseudomonas sp. CCI3.2]|uniref:D-alanyl-D-alanine carboxypeptidase family protein n=1 Tax=unclassified Pseudomonas TaxID=196821 RepID=UPI002AC8D106|nr:MULTISPECIES: D-alanyl-D-alanine carboxypeptidase family protein [unclassified Pseudomonas]MEB0076641.1 D-alanyl-D-alanine carboxypeptidase family protein [Pseudomonas sp. MH10out]MEB0100729.1 D-alanyl-D-alanine carboxypeptidase family protein [Pseudomonas sp. CCI3.2]MEB0130344.1 D-alanyl-D-alanine carboxypeptidase family protein [Pseudomonas sp. CCI2.4]MEB0160684.1 D-alanyl-D-alanine carboxypeptidase family protein [Pseudomonas sp. AH2 (2023)]MEB0169884.1 D-alanyl-D-alanine carboxypeptidas
MTPSPPQLNAKSWVLMDAASGNIITSHDPQERLPPASLTKLMTVYVATNEIQANRLKADDVVTISENAWRTGGSRMFLDPRSQVPVHDLLRGIVIDSGNDASVALSEHIAGSEDSFAGLMNATAKRLGLDDTHFMNPTGLPVPDHYSSAQDMAKLARAIITDESAYYSLYKNKYFTWNGIRQPNRNLLLWRDSSVDGLKTGHTDAAGYCMVTSAVRDGRRLITAVFGSTSMRNRANDAEKLLTYGFRFFDTQTYAKAAQVLESPLVWKGEHRTLPVGLLDDISLTLPKSRDRKIETHIHIDKRLVAPIEMGAVVGSVELFDGDQKLVTRPLIALQSEASGPWWSSTWDTLRLFILDLLGIVVPTE